MSDEVPSEVVPEVTMPKSTNVDNVQREGNSFQLPGAAEFSSVPREVSRDQDARALGARWAMDVRRILRLENRRAVGGWPGTMREAHAKAAWLVATTPATPLGIPSSTSMLELAKTLYASAKKTWLTHSEKEDDDWDVEP